MSLIGILTERPANLSRASKYTAFNGLIYLASGVLLILWPGVLQMVFRERAFLGNEQGLMRALGLTLVVIGWLYLFGGRAGGGQAVAASVIDRLIFVPLVALPPSLFWCVPSPVCCLHDSRHAFGHGRMGSSA